MSTVEIMIAIALWCGEPNAVGFHARTTLTVNNCRDSLSACVDEAKAFAGSYDPGKFKKCFREAKL